MSVSFPQLVDGQQFVRLQRTELGSRNEELLFVLIADHTGQLCGTVAKGHIGSARKRTSNITFPTEQAFQDHLATLEGQGFVRTQFAMPQEQGSEALERLDERVVDLLDWLFDTADASVKEFYNGRLKALSLETIAEARMVVGEIADLFALQRERVSTERQRQITALVERYYALIPTRLPRRYPPAMIVSEFTSNFQRHSDHLEQLEGSVLTLAAPRTGRLTSLRCELVPVDTQGPDWHTVAAFMARRAPGAPQIEARAIFRIHHDELQRRFEACIRGKTNVQLLAHGTRVANWRSILARGLIMPAAPTHGWRLGGGIYFGEAAKARNYVDHHPGPAGASAALLLSEVALGRTWEIDAYSGRAIADEYDSIYSNGQKAGFTYDEFVIFNPDQHLPRYLVLI